MKLDGYLYADAIDAIPAIKRLSTQVRHRLVTFCWSECERLMDHGETHRPTIEGLVSDAAHVEWESVDLHTVEQAAAYVVDRCYRTRFKEADWASKDKDGRPNWE